MNILPLITRELRVASRRKRSWWLRFVAAGILALIAILNLTGGGNLTRSTGEMLFNVLSIALFILALFSGSLITAGAWAEENAEGTVDLLLLTRLRGADIVIGRLLGDGMFVFTLIAATLPVFAVPLLAGGVAIDTVLSVAVAILFTAILSILSAAFIAVTETDGTRATWKAVLIQLALCASCLGWIPFWIAGLDRLGRLHDGSNRRGASFAAMLGFFLLCAPFALALGYAIITAPDIGEQLFMVGPGALMLAAFGFGSQPGQYVACLGGVAVMGLAMVYLTSLALGKHAAAFRQNMEDSSDVALHSRDAADGYARRRPLNKKAGDSPVAWLGAPGAIEQGISLLVIVASGGFLVIALLQFSRISEDVIHLPLLIASRLSWFVLSIAAPFLAARFYVQTRRQRAFELLLSTPLPRTEFIQPLRRVWWRFFRLPLIVVGLSTVGGQFFYNRNMAVMVGGSVDYPFWTAAVGPALMVALNCFELVASSWLAMWLALKLKTPRAAAFLAFLTLMVGPYLIFIVTVRLVLVDKMINVGPGSWAPIVQQMLIIPGALFTAAIFWYARRRVHRFFGVADDGHPAADPSHL